MRINLVKTYNYLAALICIAIPFMTYAKAFVNICMICLFLIFVISFNKQKLYEIVRQKYIIAFAVFLFFVLSYSLLNGSFFVDFPETRKLAQIIFLTILFSLVEDKRFLIYGFILGVFISTCLLYTSPSPRD